MFLFNPFQGWLRDGSFPWVSPTGLFTLFPFREPRNLLPPPKSMLRKSVAQPSPHIYAKTMDVENKDSKSGGYAWMQSATALARWACTEMKAHPVGELRFLGKPGRMNELCFCAALNCRF